MSGFTKNLWVFSALFFLNFKDFTGHLVKTTSKSELSELSV